MQLTPADATIRRQLAAAVLTLLGASLAQAAPVDAGAGTRQPPLEIDPSLMPAPGMTAPPVPAAAKDLGPYTLEPHASHDVALPQASVDQPWRADGGFLYYAEGDGRVQTAEAVVQVSKLFADESSLNLRVVVDSLTGGSPNGALPSRAAQTFSTPSGSTLNAGTASAPQTYTTASGSVASSGNGTHSAVYTIAPGALPLDKSFMDERLGLNISREQGLDAWNRLTYGAAVSREHDFMSGSASMSIAHDLDNRNTTLSLGANLEADLIEPIGGAPVPWSDYGKFLKQGNKSKRVGDLLLGVTQVVSRRWITQLNYSLDRSNGYQNDPYKILSVLDKLGATTGYVYENRPDSRLRQSLYWENKYALDHDVIELSLRYLHDDWGVTSTTADFRYHLKFGATNYLEPHWRRYHQSAANFFRFYLTQGDPALQNASADPRLAAFDANTLGLKFGTSLGQNSEFSIRVERYTQTGNGPANVPPGLQGLNLYPGLQAWMVQGGLSSVF